MLENVQNRLTKVFRYHSPDLGSDLYKIALFEKDRFRRQLYEPTW
jgi:hypothetical protein